MKLVLLDIDGTLLISRGSGRSSMAAALEQVLGQPISTEGVAFSGRTDRQIMRDILSASAIDLRDDESVLDRALAAYESEAPKHLDAARITVLPGVRDLLQALHDHREVHLGLLTGNLKSTAYLKLSLAGLDHFFPFGAFGCDDEDRNCLPPIAIERALQVHGHAFSSTDVFVIGDTTHDITCAHTSGCRAVAVCTGRYTREELEPLGPDLLLDDLSDHRSVLTFVSGAAPARAACS